MQQLHEIRLAFREPEAGYQARDVLAMLGRRDRLLVGAGVRRDLELTYALAELAQVLTTALIERVDPRRETIQHAPERPLEHVATICQQGNPPMDRPDVHHVVDHEDP